MKISIEGINGSGKTYLISLLSKYISATIIKCPLNQKLLDCVKHGADSATILMEQERERVIYNQVFRQYTDIIFDRGYLSHLIYSSLHAPNFEQQYKYNYELPDIIILIELPSCFITSSNKYTLYCSESEKTKIQNKMIQFMKTHESYVRARGFIWAQRKIHIFTTNLEKYIDDIIRLEKIIKNI